jgi:phosphate transport system permease protein
MIVLPAAKSGLVTAIVLGVARVAGETAPLLLTIGGSDQINFNPAAGSNSALPFYVWKNYSFGSEQAVARAWLGILILIILVFFLFSIARYFGRLKDRSR